MKTSNIVVSLVFSLAAFSVAQTPSVVPKLPRVSTGLTKNGSDYQIPGPKEGYVPDKETAIKIAEVILFRLYGEEDTKSQKPYGVIQDENIWWVCGTVHQEMGTAFRIAISQQTS